MRLAGAVGEGTYSRSRDSSMSKMDDLRAMREARYAQRTQGKSKPVPATKPPAESVGSSVGSSVGRPAPRSTGSHGVVGETEVPAVGLCGHRAISGRTCTREAGHAAKSHRYA